MNEKKIITKITTQRDSTTKSYIGGKPMLPEELALPTCQLCKKELTFYFQLAFEEGYLTGKTISLFSCTSCIHEEHSIPEMIQGELKDAVIPNHFLINYQTNFRVFVWKTEQIRHRQTYEEKILYQEITLSDTNESLRNQSKVGGKPYWITEEEAPKEYEGTSFDFVMQLKQDIVFPILGSAPKQKDLYRGETTNDYYTLFLANQIYIFVTRNQENPEVYILTQVD